MRRYYYPFSLASDVQLWALEEIAVEILEQPPRQDLVGKRSLLVCRATDKIQPEACHK